jgi:hypothetical protein
MYSASEIRTVVSLRYILKEIKCSEKIDPHIESLLSLVLSQFQSCHYKMVVVLVNLPFPIMYVNLVHAPIIVTY